MLLASDKTTVSVATGHNEYYPLYILLGNVHNSVRRAHRGAVSVLAFLSFPKRMIVHFLLCLILRLVLADRSYADDDKFRSFRRQLFHSSLSMILSSLKDGMTKYEVLMCPDGHYRRVLFELGPYMADYPEQALLACILQGWCARWVENNFLA